MSNYPKKCWYVAATSDEIIDSPLARRILGEDIVLWRGASGRVTALENRCAHRAFPLSHSSVDGDRLICGYHGCTYDANGDCVSVSSQPHVPSGMRVRAFPLLEEPPFVWIWLGPRAAAEGDQPPRPEWINDPTWTTFASTWQVHANYLMLHEHYLDFSYAPVVHETVLPPGIERMPAFDDVEVTETTVSYSRRLPEAPLAEWEADVTGLDPTLTYKRRETGTFVSPAMHFQRWDIEASTGEVYSNIRTHGITPETENSTHVFMHVSRNYRTDRDATTTYLSMFVADVARRDTSILEAVSRHSGYDRWRSGAEFQADTAALRARRIISVMLANEAGRSVMPPAAATVGDAGH